jgi:mRNA-degrading endonuclease HigB of HigAB toxin-antitoxin module
MMTMMTMRRRRKNLKPQQILWSDRCIFGCASSTTPSYRCSRLNKKMKREHSWKHWRTTFSNMTFSQPSKLKTVTSDCSEWNQDEWKILKTVSSRRRFQMSVSIKPARTHKKRKGKNKTN